MTWNAVTDAVERTHWYMLRFVAQGHTCAAVARMVAYREDWVRTIVHRSNAHGRDGIIDRWRTTPDQRSLLTSTLRDELRMTALGSVGKVRATPEYRRW